MKLNSSTLKQLIKEELWRLLREQNECPEGQEPQGSNDDGTVTCRPITQKKIDKETPRADQGGETAKCKKRYKGKWKRWLNGCLDHVNEPGNTLQSYRKKMGFGVPKGPAKTVKQDKKATAEKRTDAGKKRAAMLAAKWFNELYLSGSMKQKAKFVKSLIKLLRARPDNLALKYLAYFVKNHSSKKEKRAPSEPSTYELKQECLAACEGKPEEEKRDCESKCADRIRKHIRSTQNTQKPAGGSIPS